MPQYRYAYNERGSLVDVTQLTKDHLQLSDRFVCIGCGERLIPKLKERKKEKHFAHKVENISCTRETYLHKLAKQTFFDVYSKCLENTEPFIIELTHPTACSAFKAFLGDICEQGKIKKEHDLTKYYNRIELEKKDGDFTPDLLLFNSTDETKKIYIEIAVTHFLSEKKLNSDYRIVEIPIATEDDVDNLRTQKLTEANAKFVNFSTQTVQVANVKECYCARYSHYCLFVYKNGKSFMEHAPLASIESKHRKISNNIIHKRMCLLPYPGYQVEAGQLYINLLEEAYEDGVPIKNCFLCKYAGQNFSSTSSQPIFCKFLKKTCGSNEAADCQYYRIGPKKLMVD